MLFNPGEIVVDFSYPISITKEETQSFQKFAFSRKSEMYDLLLIATSIVQFESSLGDAETLLYSQYYPDLNIEKIKTNGDTIYTVKNVVTKESFRFATRSLVWPPGYGFTEESA